MTDEKLNVVVEEKKECNCIVCKLLKSDCLKKFAAVTLASFIGCSLALLAFAPKKHHPMPRHPHAPYVKMMDRPMPPHREFRNFERQGGPEFRGQRPRHHEFRGEHRKFKGGERPTLPTPEAKPVKAID